MGIFDKAKDALSGQEEQDRRRRRKGRDMVDEKTEGKYAEQVDQGQEMAKDKLSDTTMTSRSSQPEHSGPALWIRFTVPQCRGRRVGRIPSLLPLDVLLNRLDVVLGSPHHGDKGAHRGNFLDLFLDEPLHELVRGEVALLAGDPGQLIDLSRDPALLLKGEFDGGDDIGKSTCGALLRERGLRILVDEVLDHHHRVVALFQAWS